MGCISEKPRATISIQSMIAEPNKKQKSHIQERPISLRMVLLSDALVPSRTKNLNRK